MGKLWCCLRSTRSAIDIFLDNGGFCAEEVAQTFLGYESYLRKIESLINDIGVLSKLPQSSRCKQLFTFESTVKALYGQVSKANSVPQTPQDWETVFEKALLFRNDQGLDGEDYVIDVEKIEEDTAYMAREAIKRDLVIHCEVRILVYIFKPKTKSPVPPKRIPILAFRSSPAEVVAPFSQPSIVCTTPAL
jgi:hypothetical protein